MSKRMVVPDTVHEQAKTVAKDRDMTFKEALREMVREGGYDV